MSTTRVRRSTGISPNNHIRSGDWWVWNPQKGKVLPGLWVQAQLSLLRRNISKCPIEIRSKCVSSLIRPILEYGCEVWDPHHQQDKEFLEKTQKRCARFATGNYCFEPGNSDKNLRTLNWDLLETRRSRIKLNTFQKARLNLLVVPTDHLKLKNRLSRHCGGGPMYAREFSPVDGHIYSFFPSTCRLWNTLPAEVKVCNDIHTFTKYLNDLDIADLKSKAFADFVY